MKIKYDPPQFSEKRREFMRHMNAVAEEHHCTLDIKFNTIEPERVELTIGCPILNKEYVVFMDQLENMTSTIISIWSDFFRRAYSDPGFEYCRRDVELTKNIYRNTQMSSYGAKPHFGYIPSIKDVIFNGPATIVFWNDGSKTVVRCQEYDAFDPEKGLAMAIAKKALGNKGNYCNVFHEWCGKYDVAPIYPNIPICNELHTSSAFNDFLNAMKKLNDSFGKEKTDEQH